MRLALEFEEAPADQGASLVTPESESARVEAAGASASVQVFGDYEIDGEVPAMRGGMGVVYRARQLSSNRVVALKILQGGTLATPEQLRRFRVEAETTARLCHPHIVPVYEFGEWQGVQYFSMKWLPGGSLAKWVSDERWSLRERIECLLTVAQAIQHAHEAGVLHRDLKPGNILFDEHGQPHLTDFGLAKVFDYSDATSQGDLLGSFDYMSPEQAAGDNQAVRIPSEIFSFGCLLYHVVTGRPPFHANDWAQTLHRIRFEHPPLPNSINANIDRQLESICLDCLQKNPDRRPQIIQEVVERLERWCKADSDPSFRENSFPPATWRSKRRLLAAVAVLALASVAVIFWLSNRSKRSTLPAAENERPVAAIPEQNEATNSTPSMRPKLEARPVAASTGSLGSGVDLSAWELSSGTNLLPHAENGVLTLSETDALLISRRHYRDVVFRARLAAAAGTEAYLGVRLQQSDADAWAGITSCIYDDGTNIRAGMQWTNFAGNPIEHGKTRVTVGRGEPFTLAMRIKGDVMWVTVNGRSTSGVSYRYPRFGFFRGCVGIKVVKGSLEITELTVQPLE